MKTELTMDQVRVRQNLWLFAQGEGDDTLTLTREEGRALWDSILAGSRKRILAESTLEQIKEKIEDAYVG